LDNRLISLKSASNSRWWNTKTYLFLNLILGSKNCQNFLSQSSMLKGKFASTFYNKGAKELLKLFIELVSEWCQDHRWLSVCDESTICSPILSLCRVGGSRTNQCEMHGRNFNVQREWFKAKDFWLTTLWGLGFLPALLILQWQWDWTVFLKSEDKQDLLLS
jgi:hypothetical protein